MGPPICIFLGLSKKKLSSDMGVGGSVDEAQLNNAPDHSPCGYSFFLKVAPSFFIGLGAGVRLFCLADRRVTCDGLAGAVQ